MNTADIIKGLRRIARIASEYDESGARILYDAANTIIKLSTPSNEKWIPCEKEMPKVNQPVLVSDKNKRVCIRAVTSNIGGKKSWSQDKFDILAWQPLPQGYEPELMKEKAALEQEYRQLENDLNEDIDNEEREW